MKVRVLVVDFEPRSREATVGILREHGYDPVPVTCPADWSRRIQQPGQLPPIALIEPLLPGTDGFQVCREFRTAHAGRPCLTLVGTRILFSERYRQLAHQAGADLFYKRPDQNGEALARIARWIEGSGQVRLEAEVDTREPVAVLAGATGRQSGAETADGESVFSEKAIDQALQGAFRAPSEPGPLPTPADPPAGAGNPAPAEEDLDEVLSRALGTPQTSPGDTPPPAEDMDADAALDALFTGDTKPRPKAPLQGMDQGTAELLSTLEELEASVPQSPDEPTYTGEWGWTGGSGPREVETSIPLSPPPPPEEEASLDAIFSNLPSPIAEPVEPVTTSTTGITGSGGEKAVPTTGKARSAATPQPRLTPHPASSPRRLPLAVLLAIGALLAVVALGTWTLRSAHQAASAAAPAEADPVAVLPPAPTAGDQQPTAPIGTPADRPEAHNTEPADPVAAEAPEPPPVRTAPASPAGARPPRPEPALAKVPPAPAAAPATRTIPQAAIPRRSPAPAPAAPATLPVEPLETAPLPAPVEEASAPLAEEAAPALEAMVPDADPVLTELALEPDPGAPEEVLTDSELAAEQAPPPRMAPLIPGIGGVSMPEVIPETRIEPIYPDAARRLGLSGKVILQVVIRRDGSVGDIQVLREPPGGHGFGEAAKVAVSQWRYHPAMRVGRPVDAQITVTIQFNRN
ncbi:MAG: TonB family protein [Acidobacteriota bacterium]|nr:TonB family protein [Acidobacteriota bacterium]